MTDAPTGAFSLRSALVLVVGGAALFVALLWMIGTGYGDDFNDGGSHAGGKGLNGFAGLVRLADAEGWATGLARDDAGLNLPGLLVLTPAADVPGTDIARIVARHRRIGPVMVIGPKWAVQRLAGTTPGARRGWVALTGVQPPSWPGFLDKVSVSVLAGARGAAVRWRAAGLTGRLPDAGAIEPGAGADDTGRPLVPLVRVAGGAQPERSPMLAAYIADARATPALERMALDRIALDRIALDRIALDRIVLDRIVLDRRPQDGGRAAAGPVSAEYPLVMVFEPDLLDNYGLADPANAALAGRLLAATASGVPHDITFDLTLAGLGHAPNLLTLAFTPPYLATTLCLILTALAAGWRSFCRFGNPRAPARELAFGKARLVENSGALILRARRLHLLGPPYVAACRDRVARSLGLPRHADPAQTDAAIDRALAARPMATAAPSRGFAETARDLHHAHGAAAIVAAAQALHQLEKRLTR